MTLKRTLLTVAAGFAAIAVAGAALAQDASALRASGQVGETGDGFMACVASCDPATLREINEINGKRAAAYRDIAARTGVSEAAAGQAAAQKLVATLPPGTWYKPLGGSWTRK